MASRWAHYVSFLSQGSPATLGLLVVFLVLALVFEFSNGFHDTANAVATVIYTNSPKPTVVWSGIMNFLGVILGGIAVAYALVELIPPRCPFPAGRRISGRDARCSLYFSAFLEPGNMVVRNSQFEFACPYRCTRWYRDREFASAGTHRPPQNSLGLASREVLSKFCGNLIEPYSCGAGFAEDA